jgi:hypothetical protein
MFKLTKANIGALYEELPKERLCKTFTDALTVLRAVEINHLWIDSLCIIQDDVRHLSQTQISVFLTSLPFLDVKTMRSKSSRARVTAHFSQWKSKATLESVRTNLILRSGFGSRQ